MPLPPGVRPWSPVPTAGPASRSPRDSPEQERGCSSAPATRSAVRPPSSGRAGSDRAAPPPHRIINWAVRTFGSDAAGGALPALRAAADPDARAGEHYGPSGLGSFEGAPKHTTFSARPGSPRSRAG
ncbi:hypothetical protein ABT010_03275 [Streptomyces sp. NPDC002668]|uniref:hypothetical protein n=1 Tax=Streptomyces sp. NPDC002668 TaxID=3154422 RepID=UPI00331F953D